MEDRISSYAIPIDVHDEKYVLVHGLYGFVDLISEENFSLLNKWIEDGISITTHTEKNFLEELKKRNYIMSRQEEVLLRDDLIDRLVKKNQKTISNLKSATFIPSYRCNFDCPYCYERNLNRNSPILTREKVDAILSEYELKDLEHVGFYGGEPFLPEHMDIIGYIISRVPHVEYTAITNGYYLEEYIPLLKTVNVKQIQVTFDGTKEVHNQTRILCDGGGTFERILHGVKECVKNNIPIKIRMNLNHRNINSCYVFKEWLTTELNNTELLTFDMQELFQYNGEKQAYLTNKVLEESQNGKTNIILENMPSLARFFYNGEQIKPIIGNCTSVLANRFYDPYGNIYACFLSVGNPKCSIGTYYPEFKYKSESILTRNATKIEECKQCKYLFLCGGGCPNPLIESEGSIMKPNCRNMKYTLEYLLPLVYHNVYKKNKMSIHST